MADKEKEKYAGYPYALNWKDIWKYDPARLLDLGNNFQAFISQNKPEIDEEARAITNFEKLTEDRTRPISHTLVDASRVVPDIAAAGTMPLIKGLIKGVTGAVGKGIAKGATKGVAKTLISEGTSDAAKAVARSKFLPEAEKKRIVKNWYRSLLENENAMERIAGRKLSDKETQAVRKNLEELLPGKIDKYNADVDKLKDIYKKLNFTRGQTFETRTELISYLNKNKKSLGLTDTEIKNLIKNIDSLTDGNIKISHQHLNNIDDIIGKEKKVLEQPMTVKELLSNTILSSPVGIVTSAKGFDAGKDFIKGALNTDTKLEMKPDYWTQGSEPTPVSDFIASVFNVDFDDPARFNKKDIDTFFEFLEDTGAIEPGIKDKWTPRQKVSVLREMMSDKDYGSYIKERWAKSKHKKNLTKYYSGE